MKSKKRYYELLAYIKPLRGPKLFTNAKSKYSCWIQKWAQKFTLSWKWAQAQNWATNQAWSIKWVENEALKISQLPHISHIEKEPKIQAVPKPQKAQEPKRNEMAPSWSIYAFSLLLDGSRHLSWQRSSWWCSLSQPMCGNCNSSVALSLLALLPYNGQRC